MTIKGKGKGKEVAGKTPARKRGFDDDKTGGGRKRKNRGVLQFFEDSADVDESDDSNDSDFSDDFFDEDFDALPRMMNEPVKGQNSLPFVPKEELVDEEEFDRMMEERYGDPSRFISFAGDGFDDKTLDPSLFTGAKELIPAVWKVKCTVGRERLSAFSLMQKFADLKSLGTTLQIISAFAVDHMKGFVYIEAEKQYDIHEACKGIPGIYVTRVQPVPTSEVNHLFSVRSRRPEISEGMWARIKNGNYKGDLAQVVAMNNTRKKVTVRLIPRIDLQALAAKFGGGYSRQKTAVPAPRLISSSELEEFRPLIQFRRDRDTGKVFEVLDGLMLKDGYVYKKVSPDALSLWGVVPTEEELLKFGPSENNESNDLDWLSQLYGDSKKKRVIRADKGGGKEESSSGSGVVNGFELYDLVCYGKKDFGVIIGMDKDDTYRILKESSEGSVAVTIERHEIKSGLFDLKLSTQDHHSKTILVNDSVRVLEGPSKGRQGIVKHIYRGIVFLYDGNDEENGGYFACKSNVCEKVKLDVGDCNGKDSEPGPLVFEDEPSSPRSPLSPKKPWQARENNREFNRGDNNSLFTIGQTLRIRIGPLKGYLCRVIALRRSDVTVKLDSQQKVLTVKCEHLSEVQGKTTAMSSSDPDSSSSKSFDLLGTGGSSGGWMDGVGTSTGGGGWNAGGTSTDRSAWSNHSGPSLKPESASNPFSSKGAEDTAWEAKNTSSQNSAWGAAFEKGGTVSDPDQSGGWGQGGGNWGQAEHKIGSMGDDNQNIKWKNKANDLGGNQSSGWDSKSNWNTGKASAGESSGWSSVKRTNETSSAGWGEGNGFKSGSNDGGNLNSTWGGWNSGTCGIKKAGNPAGTSDVDNNKDVGWKNKLNKDGSKPSGWETKSNWNAPISSSKVKSGWNQKSSEDHKEEKGKDQGGWNAGKSPDGSAAGFGQASSWGNMKSGSSTVAENQDSDQGKAGNWNSGNQDSNWGKKSSWNSSNTGNQASEANNSSWNSGSGDLTQNSDQGNNSNQNSTKSSWGVGNEKKNSNWGSGHTDPGNQDSNWGKKSSWNSGNSGNQASATNNSNWESGSGDSNQNSNLANNGNWNSNKSSWGAGNENKSSNWSSGHTDAGNQDSNWGKKSNWNSGNSGNQASDPNNSNQNSGSSDSNQTSNWGNNANQNSNNCSWGEGNENKNSNWSSGHTDAGNQDSNWGKKSNWNSGNSGNQASDPTNNSNWNSGSGDYTKNSNWGNNSNWNSNKFSWSMGNENKNTNWSSGHTDPGNQDSSRGVKNNWNAGSCYTNQNTSWRSNSNSNTGNASSYDKLNGDNEGPNETSDDGVGGGNWRGGYRGRGGFRGRGFRGRGERGGFGGRGDRGGFGGRGDRGGFSGRRGSDRGFGGRGRGWNNRRDSGDDGSSDWKKGMDNVEGWKNNSSGSGSGSWNQDNGDKKNGQSWSHGNADKERPSWNQGGGSNKQWQSWSSASGVVSGSWKSEGSGQLTEAKDGGGWTRGDCTQENVSGKGDNWASQRAWNREIGDKDGQSWSRGNAGKERPNWNQGGGSNEQWQGGSSASGGASDSWNSIGSKQTAEAKDGAGWTSSTDHGSSWKKSTIIEETNIQESGWNKGSNSNITSGAWGESSVADKGQSSS